MDLVFRARRVITPAGETACDVGVRDGRIVAVEPRLEASRVVELGDDEVLLPGLVDTHVHVNDPGRSEWEGFDSATRAAAAGGVTTIVDMPLNSLPPTVDVSALEIKRKAAEGRVHVDVGFWGGIIPGNLGELRPLHDAGVFGFKAFLLHSGVDEFPHVSEDELMEAGKELASLGALGIVHCEDEHALKEPGPGYAAFLGSRPGLSELTASAVVLGVSYQTGARMHVVHVSSQEVLSAISAGERLKANFTAETCPHYLTFVAEEIADGQTQFKCCPPIREAANREELWRALGDGRIRMVVSDHSPCTPELKEGDFLTAWGGIASLQLGLSAVWTGARQRGFTLSDVALWMAQRPAELVGVERKGRIEVGRDADFAVFAPDDAFVVDRAKLHHRNPVTPYHGRPLAGVVRRTYLRGKEITGSSPFGELLRRGEA